MHVRMYSDLGLNVAGHVLILFVWNQQRIKHRALSWQLILI